MQIPALHRGLISQNVSTRGATSSVPLRSETGSALIAATVLASAVAAFGGSVIRVAVPAIGRDLNAGVAAVQWTVTGYLVTAAALLLLAGALADRFGRKRILIVGLLVMLVSSFLCAVAPTVEALIGAGFSKALAVR